ncbi:universal stress protein [Oryzibacter oryziterrae]|uniref:universal stress protein n=1 Tax=Oryzibacter oryziterrae TaxID=2766474 RepID=UPI001F48144F|nr:universal stress protein [Oryzibacter oryziterrae]
MVSKRLSREEGHRRKFLCVVDDTPECDRAVIYAASRAARSGGGLVMLYVIPPGDFQHWRGVEEMMRAEAMDKAEESLARRAERARAFAAIDPELVIREGKAPDAINAVIEEDRDISILVLAAGVGNEGPGPLVSAVAAKSGIGFAIPVTIVPGNLSDDDIVAVV